MARRTIERSLSAVILATALALTLLVIRAQFELAIGAAVCVERANFYLISCVPAPPEWQFVVTGALAVTWAVLLGTRLQSNAF